MHFPNCVWNVSLLKRIPLVIELSWSVLKYHIQSGIITMSRLRSYIYKSKFGWSNTKAKGYRILPSVNGTLSSVVFLFRWFSHTFQPLNLPFCFWSNYLLFFICGYNKFWFTLRGTHYMYLSAAYATLHFWVYSVSQHLFANQFLYYRIQR